MATELDQASLCKQFISVYEQYIRDPVDSKNMDIAFELHEQYWLARDLVDYRLARAIDGAIVIGFPRGIVLSRADAESILQDLCDLMDEQIAGSSRRTDAH
jgi:hypothetical protein